MKMNKIKWANKHRNEKRIEKLPIKKGNETKIQKKEKEEYKNNWKLSKACQFMVMKLKIENHKKKIKSIWLFDRRTNQLSVCVWVCLCMSGRMLVNQIDMNSFLLIKTVSMIHCHNFSARNCVWPTQKKSTRQIATTDKKVQWQLLQQRKKLF